MARMIKTKEKENRLETKTKIRRIVTLDRTMMIIQTIALVYLAVKASGLVLF